MRPSGPIDLEIEKRGDWYFLAVQPKGTARHWFRLPTSSENLRQLGLSMLGTVQTIAEIKKQVKVDETKQDASTAGDGSRTKLAAAAPGWSHTAA